MNEPTPHSPDQPSSLFRTRTWLGQERIAFTYRNRHYTFRRLRDAQRARERLLLNQHSYAAWIVVLSLLIMLLTGVWAVSLRPGLLLAAVDGVRSIVGPAPIAYAETQVFRLGTFVREVRVRLGDTAPRWSVAGAVTPLATQQAPVFVPTSEPTQASEPTAATALSSPTASPAVTALITATVVRGGNLRQVPIIEETNILGWVIPGDMLEVLETEGEANAEWLHVRLLSPSADQNERPVANGTVGWISRTLFEPLPTPTQVLPTLTAAPTAPLLFAPTPIPPTPIVSPTPIVPTSTPTTSLPAPTTAPPAAPITSGWGLAPITTIINDGQVPNEGQWQLLAASADNSAPAMAVTTFRPDVTRPDIQVAVAAIDLARAELRMVAGTLEPESDLAQAATLPRTGRIPQAEYDRLLAAFNGGFKALHGSDGMAANGIVYRNPVERRATIATFSDGRVKIGLWGRDLTLNSGAISWRQNGHLLVENGAITPKALEGGLGWGASVDLQVETWRSGVGVSADGRTLFYAVGDALTSARLAEALHTAGAANALQLDINNYWVRFTTFQRNNAGQLVSQPLISAMPQDRAKYLGVEERDFMYVVMH